MGSCTSKNNGDYKGEYPDFTLNVISKISGDPEKCLFDFQYNDSEEHTDKISSWKAVVKTNCFLHAMQSEVVAQGEEEKKAAAVHDRMLAFTFSQGKYWIFNGKENEKTHSWETLKDKAWVILNNIKNNKQSLLVKKDKYKLKNGDIVRFGRVVFRTTIVQKNSKYSSKVPAWEEHYEIVDKPWNSTRGPVDWESTKTVLPFADQGNAKDGQGSIGKSNFKKKSDSVSDSNSDDSQVVGSEEENQDGEIVWRIWYGAEDDVEVDPLIEPCKCSGSVRFVHLSCAKSWINEELTQDINEHVKSYCWERISCEMWHAPFKDVVYKNNKMIKLFEKEQISNDTYLVFESIYPDRIKIYFGLLVDKENSTKTFELGRSRNCQIKLNLDSISRNHAEIIYDKGEFYIKDAGSTFGTLVLLQQPLVFNKKGKDEVAIQSGPTLIEIKNGGKKKIEHTYTSKDGVQKKCAVYNEFKHKIPTQMRNFIDRNTTNLEVIRLDNSNKPMSVKNIPKESLDFDKKQQFLSNNNIVFKKNSEEAKTDNSSKLKRSQKNTSTFASNQNIGNPGTLRYPQQEQSNYQVDGRNNRHPPNFDSSQSPSVSPQRRARASEGSMSSEDNPQKLIRVLSNNSEEEKSIGVHKKNVTMGISPKVNPDWMDNSDYQAVEDNWNGNRRSENNEHETVPAQKGY